MTVDDDEFGTKMTFDEAMNRFVDASIAEANNGVVLGGAIPEGMEELVVFKGIEIRKVLHQDEWWFSVVDVVGAISESTSPRRYWSDLKAKLLNEEEDVGLQDCIVQLKMESLDGSQREIDAANTETILRIIQSIPSKRAQPFKRWLAKVGYERIQESQNPEIAIKRAILTYQLQGRSDDWIEKRIRSIVTRKELTSEWKNRGVEEGKQYAVLTNIISMNTFGIDNQGHKCLKGLKSQNLRDHMTDLELIFTMLGEKSTTEIARTKNVQGYFQNIDAAKAGGNVAGTAREQLETQTGESIVSPSNFVGLNKRISDPEKLTFKGG